MMTPNAEWLFNSCVGSSLNLVLDEVISGDGNRDRFQDLQLKNALPTSLPEGFRKIPYPPYLEYVGPASNNNNNNNNNNIVDKHDYQSLPSDEVIDEAYEDEEDPEETFRRPLNTWSFKNRDPDAASIHSTDTIHDEASMYSSTVSIPLYYCNLKNTKRNLPKTYFRKFSGLPLAALYGLLFYVIMEHLILSTPDSSEIFHLEEEGTHAHGDHFHDEDHQPIPPPEQLLDAMMNLTEDLSGSHNTTRMKTAGREGAMTYTVDFGDTLNDHQGLLQKNSSTTDSNSSRHDHFHHNHTDDSNATLPHHREEVIYASVALSIGLGAASIHSRGTRCSMMLILPGMITRRSKTFILTLVAGILAKQPITNIFYNLNDILESTGCLYAQVTTNVGLILDVIQEKLKAVKKEYTIPGIGTFKLEFNLMKNFTSWEALRNMIKAPHIAEIKHRMEYIGEKFQEFGSHANTVRKVLTGISVILIVLDAVKYLRLYYSDSSFDNKYVDHLTTKRWRKRKFVQLTPLRHWEYKYGYKIPGTRKVGKKEFMKMFRRALPTVLFSLFALMVIASDYMLSYVLQYVKDRKTFEISFDGMDKDLLKKVTSFNISADACISEPRVTEWPVYMFIVLLLVLAFISCILDVFMSRIRARVCNFFYNDRARERADYLHYKLSAGRNIRKMQLKLKIRRELERRERLKEFSPWSHFTSFFCRCCGEESWTHVKRFLCFHDLRGKPLKVKCPGCGWKVLPEDMRDVSFALGKSKIMNMICSDCFKEFTFDQTPDMSNLTAGNLRKGRLNRSMPLLRDDYDPRNVGTL